MKKLCLSLVLAACGGSKPVPAPVANTAPSSSESAPEGNGTIRVVQRGKDGGVVEIEGNRDAAMRAAEAEMKTVCGAGMYTITQEGEEVVAPRNGSTMTETAWRVHYACAK